MSKDDAGRLRSPVFRDTEREAAARHSAAPVVDPPDPPRVHQHRMSSTGREALTWAVIAVVVVAVLVGIGYALFSAGNSTAPAFDAPANDAAVADGTCFDTDTTAAINLRSSLTGDVDLAGAADSQSVTLNGITYVATPVGAGDSALVASFPAGKPDAMRAVNGLARGLTSLPPGGSQAGIDAALGCLSGP